MNSHALLCKNVFENFCEIKIIISKVNDEGIPTKLTKSKSLYYNFYLLVLLYETYMQFYNFLDKKLCNKIY